MYIQWPKQLHQLNTYSLENCALVGVITPYQVHVASTAMHICLILCASWSSYSVSGPCCLHCAAHLVKYCIWYWRICALVGGVAPRFGAVFAKGTGNGGHQACTTTAQAVLIPRPTSIKDLVSLCRFSLLSKLIEQWLGHVQAAVGTFLLDKTLVTASSVSSLNVYQEIRKTMQMCW